MKQKFRLEIILLGIVSIISVASFLGVHSFESSASNSASTCLSTITQVKNQTETLDSKKIGMFVYNNSTDFKSLKQKYHAMWVATFYDWNTDLSSCTAQLKDITVSFELSNSTAPFAGTADVTVDPSLSKVIDIKTDIPTILVPPNCTSKACRVAHGIFY